MTHIDYTDQHRTLLESIFGDYFKTHSGFIEIRAIKKSEKIVHQLFYSSPEEATSKEVIHKLTALNATGWNIYFGVCPKREKGGNKENVAHVMTLWADLDDKDYEGGREEMLKRVNSFPIPPSIIVSTGHGLHLYFLLNEIIDASDPKAIEARMKDIERVLGSDAVHDVSRVLRLPGFQNVKDPKNPVPCKILDDYFYPDRRYSLSDFDCLRDVAVESQSKAAPVVKDTPKELPQRFTKLLQTDQLLSDTWNGNRQLQDSSRSGYDMSLAQQLKKHEFNNQEIEIILQQSPSGRGREATNDYLERTISKANKEEEDVEMHLLTLQELLTLDIPPMQWIFSMVIPHPALVMLTGEPGSYKTFFALWMGLRASAGLPLFDTYKEDPFFSRIECPMGKLPTVFIEEECTAQLMQDRSQGLIASGVGGPVDFLIEDGFKLRDERWRKKVLEVIKRKNVKLLILDPFCSSITGLKDENDNAEVAEVMEIIRKQFVKIGVTVIALHHPSKGDRRGKGIRGAGDILGKCDLHLCLEVEDELERIIKLTYGKLRVADRRCVSDFRMRLDGDGYEKNLSFSYLGKIGKEDSMKQMKEEELKQQILEAMEEDEELTRAEVAERVGRCSTGAFDRPWKALKKSGDIAMNSKTNKFHRVTE